MFDQGGLSLDQAPPVWVVFGLFLMGSIFGILGGASLLYWGRDIFDASSTGALVVVHLLALGVMMSFMLGALFQMLPVIAGVVLKAPTAKANIIKAMIATGTISLVAGFTLGGSWLFLLASVLLGGSLLYISISMLYELSRVSHHSASSKGMMFSLLNMLFFALPGLYMSTFYAGLHDGSFFVELKQIHYTSALFGWVALLIVSISFQTVEMFYVTPAYPKALSRYMPLGVTLLLVGLSIGILAHVPWIVTISQVSLYLLLMGYGVVTMRRLSQRKRPLADATMWFWRMGMVSLRASMVLLIFYIFTDNDLLMRLGAVLFLSFALSVLFAMFYKIVPFLTWFHLNSQGYFSAPMMHEVIHPKTAKKHFWIHLAMILSLAGMIFVYLPIAGALMILSFGWIGFQVLRAGKLYRDTQAHGEKFDMGIMG